MARRKKKPACLLHQRSGQARVRFNGKDHYPGPYDSSESYERYDELIASWITAQAADPVTITVDELALRFVEHAQQHYRKNGKVTSELSCIRTALRYAVSVCGTVRVRDFGPLRLKSVRSAMVGDGHCRSSIPHTPRDFAEQVVLLASAADLQPRMQETHQNGHAGKQGSPRRLRRAPAVGIDGVGLVVRIDVERTHGVLMVEAILVFRAETHFGADGNNQPVATPHPGRLHRRW